MNPSEAINKSKESALKALELDDQLAEAYASLAYIKFRIDWEWDEAENLFKKAIELKPGYSIAHEWYGLFLLVRERFDEALQQMLRAEMLDPLSSSARNGVGRVYEFTKQFDKAIEQFNKIIKADPNFAEAHAGLSSCYFQLGEYDKSINERKKSIELSGGRGILKAALGNIYGSIGKEKEANEILKEFQKNNVSPQYLAIVYSGLGEKEKAINYLYDAYEKRESSLIYLKIFPLFDPLRDEIRFKELLKKIGLSDD
jgi:tetratricopeptide (TPR) repeat protein